MRGTKTRAEKTEVSDDAPRILEKLIQQAVMSGASDVHLQKNGEGAHISFRLDGVMTPSIDLEPRVSDRVFGRIKFLARLKTYLESLPQDGRIDGADVGSTGDIRVATYPTVTGEKIVLRLFASFKPRSINDLNFPGGARDALERFLKRSSGMLLLTGPAGSGKTTTIYSCLQELLREGGRHIITIEDPVEQILDGVMQTEANEARGLSFAKAARDLLRQDPQVLVIGEIRDQETANIAVQAAFTGHLVLSTLHAGSCEGVFERMLGMCTDRYAMASAVDLVVNQRLIRSLCPECVGSGCGNCLQTGYKGRRPLVEWLRVDDALRKRLRTNRVNSINALSTLEDEAAILVRRKITSRNEVRRMFAQ